MPSVNASVWADMVALANWLETSKMASALTGPALGGPIIADMLDRMLVAADDKNVNRVRLLVVSGHYNTQLGVLAALYLDNMMAAQTAAVPWLTRIPATAAVLAFELHRSDGSFGNATFAARLVAQDGPAANYTVFPLPCASAAGAAIAGEVRQRSAARSVATGVLTFVSTGRVHAAGFCGGSAAERCGCGQWHDVVRRMQEHRGGAVCDGGERHHQGAGHARGDQATPHRAHIRRWYRRRHRPGLAACCAGCALRLAARAPAACVCGGGSPRGRRAAFRTRGVAAPPPG
jgi:hypothetical protein